MGMIRKNVERFSKEIMPNWKLGRRPACDASYSACREDVASRIAAAARFRKV